MTSIAGEKASESVAVDATTGEARKLAVDVKK